MLGERGEAKEREPREREEREKREREERERRQEKNAPQSPSLLQQNPSAQDPVLSQLNKYNAHSKTCLVENVMSPRCCQQTVSFRSSGSHCNPSLIRLLRSANVGFSLLPEDETAISQLLERLRPGTTNQGDPPQNEETSDKPPQDAVKLVSSDKT